MAGCVAGPLGRIGKLLDRAVGGPSLVTFRGQQSLLSHERWLCYRATFSSLRRSRKGLVL